ncbi:MULTISPECIES: SCO1664 family protein [unclassified Rhodococcus (in: high G+C Gram-positive bacteria)]|uniref:SCO1664 family protein n=1 Tax=unclassified Rhodococcus (in: high G+C Gram-positive bacteria) TaxID=192944 RepID=UPI0019EFD39D|nr:SCO1664 family protein [Rhodococcus sp. (in: high G+C Gram-positive bacteria)]MBF0661429.1 SCO1664 family protein [Rhodococcus sp. (in: high G+C Gram-positive bacteria)]
MTPVADLRTVLTEGELTVIGQIAHASNATLVCDASYGGTVVRCVYKPVRGERPLWDFPDGTLAGREVASYLICEALGWGVIPLTVLRDGPFGPGMVQRWIDTRDPSDGPADRLDVVDLYPAGAVPEGWLPILRARDLDGDDVLLIHADDPRLHRMAVLDLVLNNADRKGGHALEGVDGNVYGIDHGICLHRDDKLRTVLWGWAGDPIDPALLTDLDKLARRLEGEFADVLREYITADEVEALRRRIEALLEHPVMPRPLGERRIPWPAF